MVEIGSTLGGYRIEGIIGRGGMGVVYRATQLRLDRTVALKVITPAFANDPSFRERFDRESRVTASIDHPNVVPVHEANEADGLLYIVMRYVDGKDLRAVIAETGRLDPARAARLTAQVGAALDAAHTRGMVHRDVKPGNILVSGDPPEEHVYLTDFGLTKDVSSGEGLTRTGEWVGTLDYVAPEQIEGRAVDARTDVYALGCVLHQALTGEVPFARNSDVAKMYAHMNDPAPPITESVPSVPRALDEVVHRAMAKDPAERYPSTGDFGRAAVAAAAGGSLAVPERSVAVGDAAPLGATRASAEPGQTVRSPEPPPAETVRLPASAPQSPAPVARATDPVARAPMPPSAPQSGSGKRGLAIAGIIALLLAGGAVAVVAGGVFEGDGEGSTVVETVTESSDSDTSEDIDTQPETDTEPQTDADTGPVAGGPCRNDFIPRDQRAQLSESIGTTEPAVQGTVFYGECEGETWALASFPDTTDGVFRRVGDEWQFIGPIQSERCLVPAQLLAIWKQPSC